MYTNISNIIISVVLLNSISFIGAVDFSEYERHTWTGQPFYGFTGIRYAQEPVGSLRFQPPVPYEPSWNLTSISDISTRTDGGPPCPSPYVLNQQSEDCLYLNVYTKNVNARSPVVVFIHPGGFYIFSGRPDHFGPEYMLDEDVVLVTFNYRLGFLGFASPRQNNEHSIGNAGLKDQALVLQWISQNIRLFGGDPENVSIMGSSAGAMSVSLHLVSPLSEGLFHRAIIISSGILPQLKLPHDQHALIRKQAQLLGCRRIKSQSPFECLMSANAYDLAASVYRMFEFGRDNPIYLWLPVVETPNEYNKAFLTVDEPLLEIQAGRWARVPILTGTNKDEFATSAYELLKNNKQREGWTDDFERWAPVVLHFERGTNASIEQSNNIWEYYFDQNSSVTNFQHVQQCGADAMANFPVHRLSSLAANYAPVFRYRFDYRGSYTNFPASDKSPDIVEHCDDLQYLFDSKLWPRISPDAGPDADMVRRMTSMIASFAKNGYPNIMDVPYWPTYENSQQWYVRIGKNNTLDQFPFKASDYWDKWFPL